MKNKKYQAVIGLEIHSELKTESKMFCSCPNNFEAKPNTNICPICLGHPGTLPVINKKAVQKVMKVGAALNCKLANVSKFDRKSYFYPDLPKGYQISQFDKPLCGKGFLEINGKKITIRRIHLEEDAGKLIHTDKNYSLLDCNRAGLPLMELVTDPDIRSAEEATAFAKELQLILRYLDISEANMEKGQMRVEVNISLSEVQEGSDELSLSNPRIEIKNLNSFKAVKNATEYEIERQTKLLKEGKRIDRETRGWDANQGKTLSQRKKEEAHDYRYLPEPDLPPLIFTDQEIEEIKKEMPELPRKKREIYKDLQIKKQDIKFFVENIKIGRFFEEVIAQLKDESKETIQLAANYITSDLKGLLNQSKKQGIKFSSQDFIEFILLIEKGEISSKIAKKVLEEMTETGKNPSLIIKEKNLSKIDDKNKIEDRIKEVLKENQNAVNDFQSGNKNALQFLIGKTMQATKGRANIATVKKILKDKLN
jgi:aspartyl-tRNA(Asn)/glutamyl-tRNA(Gln) amidotransferase subunit B